MFKAKELVYIILASAVIGYVISFSSISWENWAKFAVLGFAMLMINVIAKKIAAYKLGCEIEMEPWQAKRYWFYESAHIRYGIPMWVVWPIFMVWASLGLVWWLVVMTFEVYATRARVGRKFAELTEWDIALIASAGIVTNLVVAVIFAARGDITFAYMNLWFVFFNLIPFPAYDGGKIFFGEALFYVFIATISLIVIFLLHITTNIPIITVTSLLSGIMAIFVFYHVFERPLK
ncbi:MAG: hypothetical protein V1660_01885 [archaeon]